MPLRPHATGTNAEDGKRPDGLQSLLTIGGSLAIVLAAFMLVVWLLRRASPGTLAPLPPDVFETLGRAALANRQPVHLLRCGKKLLLVVSGPAGAGASTLTEITDPDEVERLVALCRGGRFDGAASRLSRDRGNRDA